MSIKLNDEYKIETIPENVVLCKRVLVKRVDKKKIKTGETEWEWKRIAYVQTVQAALKAFKNDYLKYSDNFDDLIVRIDYLNDLIDEFIDEKKDKGEFSKSKRKKSAKISS